MSGLSGWAQGLEKGLESLVRFQGIKEQRDRADRTEARQSVIQGREDTAYAEANETAPFKTGMPGGQPVQDYLVGFGSNFGFIDKDGNIKRKDRMAFQKAFNDDVHAQHDILQIQSRELTREIGELQKSLGGRGPSDDLTGVTENINRQLQEKIEKKTNLDNTNKAFLEALKQKNKEREFGLSEEKAVRDAKKAEGEEARAKSKEEREAKAAPFQHLPKDSGEALAIATRTKKPEDYKMYQTMKADELEKEAAKQRTHAAASREFAPTNLQKDFGFYRRLYPDETNEETLARVQKQDIPTEKKFIIDMVKEAKKNGDDIVIAENEARTLYRKLTGGVEKGAPAPEIAVSPQEKKTFAAQAKVRLQGATDPSVQKTLQRQMATEILRMAGGNKDAARKLAKEMGLGESLGVK